MVQLLTLCVHLIAIPVRSTNNKCCFSLIPPLFLSQTWFIHSWTTLFAEQTYVVLWNPWIKISIYYLILFWQFSNSEIHYFTCFHLVYQIQLSRLNPLCTSFSRTDSGLCLKLNCFYSSQWINFPTHSCLFLFSFWTNLLHLLIM